MKKTILSFICLLLPLSVLAQNETSTSLCDGTYSVAFELRDWVFDHQFTIKGSTGKTIRPSGETENLSIQKCLLVNNKIILEFKRLFNEGTIFQTYFLTGNYDPKSELHYFKGYYIELDHPEQRQVILQTDLEYSENNKKWDDYIKLIKNINSVEDNCDGYLNFSNDTYIYPNKIIDINSKFTHLSNLRCINNQDKSERNFYYSYYDNNVITQSIVVIDLFSKIATHYYSKIDNKILNKIASNITLIDNTHDENNSSLCNLSAINGVLTIDKKEHSVTLQANAKGVMINFHRQKDAYQYAISNSFCYQLNDYHARAGVRMNGKDYLFNINSNTANLNSHDASTVIVKSPSFTQERQH